MEDKITFDELYNAYFLCLKNKKRKIGTYTFANDDLCMNLMELMDELNEYRYVPKQSNCYVVTDPALREIYAAQFTDRIVQHFYMNEINDILETKLVKGCCSCRVGKGTDYALGLLKKYLIETSNKGKKDCYFLKIDLSGYFMSIDRKLISRKFYELIIENYKGKHKELLLYLTPIIFENNPSLNCFYKCNPTIRSMVPERRKMNPNSDYEMAIGNLTAQAGSNLNLNGFDHFVVEELKLPKYVRYVDDIVIISDSKEKLKASLPKIISKLSETNQKLNLKKTRIDTAYHGVPFLGKVTYPYGYQKLKKSTIIRIKYKAKKFENRRNLLAKLNSKIGALKKYNCRKLILNYYKDIKDRLPRYIEFDEKQMTFKQF